jgi:hypothetical protein
MNIPDEIKIGGSKYIVGTADIVDEDNCNIDGKILYSELVIRLKKNLNPEYQKEVFLHELVHGIFEMIGFEQDEDKVNRLTKGLLMVINDNPDIFK